MFYNFMRRVVAFLVRIFNGKLTVLNKRSFLKAIISLSGRIEHGLIHFYLPLLLPPSSLHLWQKKNSLKIQF